MTTLDDLRATGARQREALFGADNPVPAGLTRLLDEAVYGGVWSRPGLPLPDRMLCTLGALSVFPRLRALRRHIGAALDLGLTPLTIREIFIQTGLYAGFSAAAETMALAEEICAARGLSLPPDPDGNVTLEELTRRGRERMESLHGERSKDGYAAPTNEVAGALYGLAIQYGYGVIWFRAGLTPRQRALLAVAAFTALRLPDQLRRFGHSALNVGATRPEVVEAIIQTAPFSGFPPALNGLVALGADFLG
ncbi:MAG TPA: carboxymuconolactone decarboxylase family protein [Acetobacteraceae bacterium]|jgi:4-carboxymuconolactone decarboxylase|nr:carboxymuconolactone decarboxylase family protein [Acetobacteraceae bacterium]